MDKLNAELLEILRGLIEDWEDEVVEFKEASNNFKLDEIGRYFSAISNEANLRGLQYGWLIFGVNNKSRAIVGTDYRNKRGLETLKHEIAQDTTGNMSFIDISEVYDDGNRVVMLKIPAAVIAMPTAWKNHWYGREGESLGALSVEELDRIRGQVRRDWSKQLIDGSSVEHLDAEALQIARSSYKVKLNKPHVGKEIDAMTDTEFLTKIKLMGDGKLTNAAIILLGSPDHDDLVSPPARAMWRLHGSNDVDLDYREFRIPFITVVDRLFGMVRKLTYRYIPNKRSLTTVETEQYDESLCRELLNNCIAHMDYTIGGRIYLDEFEDRLAISNPGDFLPGSIAKVLKPEYTSPYYRNQLLADTMVLFNMIDSAAMGIRKVYRIQKDRFFPLPDYEYGDSRKVVVKVYGTTMDMNYTHILYDHPEYDLNTVFLLDKVQKHREIGDADAKYLRSLNLIDGKKPNLFISAKYDDAQKGSIGDAANVTNSVTNHVTETITEINATQRQMIELIQETPNTTLAKLAAAVGISERNIKRNMKLLQDAGIVERVGSARKGYWSITSNVRGIE
ncbi:hypothetical protein AGMMS49983_15210 [Clostridia bacterium]|nr:hypothetical protein AGMMS49983_15210 [Clostridia bacterium]